MLSSFFHFFFKEQQKTNAVFSWWGGVPPAPKKIRVLSEADCLIAKVDGLGKVDSPWIFLGNLHPPFLYIFRTLMYISIFFGT